MNRSFAVSMLSALLLTSTAVHAEEPLTDESLVVPLKRLEPAPFTGLLITPPAAAILMSEKKSAAGFAAAEVKKATDTAVTRCSYQLKEKDIEMQTERALSSAAVQTRDNTIKSLESQIKSMQESAKWTPLYIAGGIIGGAAVAILGGWTIAAVSR